MSALARDARTVAALWRRDLILLVRQRSRLVGAVAQPLLVWIVLGAGMAPTFRLGESGPGYLEYFFPGTLIMLLLFSAISTTMSVIEDRHSGFLQGVLAGPGSRGALATGKIAGSATVCSIQALFLAAVCPIAGFSWGGVRWLTLALAMTLTAVSLTSLGFAIAWWTDSTQGYHVVMNLVLLPLWMLSGALFPPEGLPGPLALAVRANPMSYATAAVRRALSGGAAPAGTGLAGTGPIAELAVLAVFAVGLWLAAARVARRRRAD